VPSRWCLGTAIGTLDLAVADAPRGPRVAHSRIVGLGHLIPTALVVAVRVVVLIAGAGMAWEIVFSLRHPQAIAFPNQASPALLLLVPAIVSWLLFEGAAWVLVHRRRNAASVAALAWDDALRASALLDLAAGTLLITLVAAAFELQETILMRTSLAYIESNGQTPLRTFTPTYFDLRTMFLLLAALVIAGIVSRIGTRRRFRRKLWFSANPNGVSS
jgi:hypothetical protein